jgi:hypothetical protein
MCARTIPLHWVAELIAFSTCHIERENYRIVTNLVLSLSMEGAGVLRSRAGGALEITGWLKSMVAVMTLPLRS